MPTYEYACKSCDEHVEVVQSFKDDPLTSCPACGGPLRKVFGSIGISFKGSGFYKTDSRPKPKGDKAAASSSSSSTSSEKSASSSDSSSGSSEKPAAKAPASTSSESPKAAAS
jgi:putative FmdB family regulatory protein